MPCLSALLLPVSVASASPGPHRAPPPPYTLAADTDDERAGSDLAELEQRMKVAHGFYRVGSVGMVAGVATSAVGLTVGVLGLFPLILTGNEALVLGGFATAAVGVGVTAVSIPVFMTASWTGAAVLRHHGVHVSRVPGWIMLGGLATAIGGAVADIGPVVGVGSLGLLGGGIAQVHTTRTAFKAYEAQQGGVTASLGIAPTWSREAGAGLSVVGTF